MQESVYIGLGANLGDRELALLRAVAELGKLPNTRITALSPFYETEPVGVTDQPKFLNAAARLATALPPLELLDCLKKIEVEVFGRKPSGKWGPRSMDLDILIYGDEVVSEERLTIPHPRLHERRFVLKPLCDIAPDLRHPVQGKTVTELLAALPAGGNVTRV
ncbi:2-amino-4-hydroxy-6-hydroxymethyldihydropteridine diphosphokinase [Geomesophilobacter sediminis]|uniref:2-amino-4-hydroxy-6-hydroxymethyldihydropteridine pyrophosphokinase n=1 Tax=Geomesophilobacter sediminis TaxID=2798584 RepID=A0A8J7SB63_9BACT|nr:2-amino-4-hydroxy-6-hydroxymethyldihydropteridine diphosphokinase [Geomesophilobacter sediminis]MBJ6727885.1 2-amino-4-hydroxy-6-hydroxymethyldihydropteridine diphosphokinase [Geomesophilobacter sediminis]